MPPRSPLSIGGLALDLPAMQRRLKKRISKGEFFALLFSLGMALIFFITRPDNIHFDLNNYLRAGRGDFGEYYYGYWFVPVFWLLNKIPFYQAALLLSIASIAALFFAGRIFGGKTAFILTGYQAFYMMYYGQLTAIVIGGLALLWWGLAKRSGWLAGLGFLIAATKYQSGFLAAVFLLVLAPIAWNEKWKVLFVPAIGFAASLLLYPDWIFTQLEILRQTPANDFASLSLWQWFGPAAAVLWLPAILTPVPPERRIILLVATTTLALPYYQQADLLSLFVLPVGWLFPLLGNLGYLSLLFGYPALKALAVIPLVIYGMILWQALGSRFASRPAATA
ncbi:MAG: hypothetical protein ROW48_06630 [Bellilinea sp.]